MAKPTPPSDARSQNPDVRVGRRRKGKAGYFIPYENDTNRSPYRPRAARGGCQEDMPCWDAKTMGNRSGLRRQDGKYYVRGKRSKDARNYSKGQGRPD